MSGSVKCWGWNISGQLGDGTFADRLTPVDVSGIGGGIQAIATGGYHTCALTTGGGVKCWGDNNYGQLGDGTTTERWTPIDVSGLGSGVQAIAAGGYHACVLTTGGGVKCWGENNYGQLGDGTFTDRLTPVDVSGLGSGVRAIATSSSHTCALTMGGSVKCWGGNISGQLGDGTTTWRRTPVDVSGMGGGVQAIAAGGGHTCALTTGGGVKCWGGNDTGQLGDGTTTRRLTPVDMSGLGNGVKAIAAGGYHTCALTTGGGVKCWGNNSSGQLGVNPGWTPVDVVDSSPSQAAVEVWLSTSDGANKTTRQADVAFTPDSGVVSPTIEIDENAIHQSMDGFGVSLTDSAAWLLWQHLDADRRTELLRSLFDPETGLGLTVVRLPMGASDYYAGAAPYTYDDNNGVADPTLANFSIAHDAPDDAPDDAPNKAYIIPILKEIQAINPAVKIIAAPWSAPAWMKTSGKLEEGRLKVQYYAVYANYFLKFIQAYAAHGLPIHAVSIQNEPHHESAQYPTMRFDAQDATRFVADYLGPLFQANAIQTQIWVWDHNWEIAGYPLSILGDAQARSYVQASAFHCYDEDKDNEWEVENQTAVHNAFPQKDIHVTECTGGEWDAQFGSNLRWITKYLLIGATRHWAKSVLRWNLALDTENGPWHGICNNCLGMVTIDKAQRSYTFEYDYYILGHLSRFVRPGAVRIGSSHFPDAIETTAFKHPDGKIVLLVFNDGTAQTDFKVRYNGASFVYGLPAHAVVTFVWQSEDPSLPPSNIAGVVRDDQGQPLAGVTMEVRRAGVTYDFVTGADGAYGFLGLEAGVWTVTPRKAGYTFLPAQQQVTLPPMVDALDFTGYPTVDSAYRPEPAGYRFKNGSRHTNWDLFRATFGAENVEWNVLGASVRRPTAELYYRLIYKCDLSLPGPLNCRETGMGGNCSGMAASSGLFFKNWLDPQDFLQNHQATTVYSLTLAMDGALWAETDVSDLIVRYQGYQQGVQIKNARRVQQGQSVAADLAAITAAIDGGLATPLQISIQGVAGDACVGHALLPYKYRVNGPETDVYVYDSNHPGIHNRRIRMNAQENRWMYDLSDQLTWGSVNNPCPGDSFVVLPLNLWREQPQPPWDEDLASATSSAQSSLIEIAAVNDQALLITDSQGRKLGVQDGQFVNEIPGSLIDIPAAFLPDAQSYPSESYLLDAPGPLSVQVTHQTTAAVAVGLFSPQGALAVELQPTGVHSAVESAVATTLLQIDANSGAISVQAGSTGLAVLTVVDPLAEADRKAVITAPLIGGEQAAVQPTADMNAIVIHPASGQVEYMLQLEQVGQQPVQFQATVGVAQLGEGPHHHLRLGARRPCTGGHRPQWRWRS
jgi:glucosylceramidase